ncbi:MAG: hypothetical protein JNL60_01405, partial [Bacteroidia bacterium]|nr:hypothetical protein [Bacteroidia bacterium]
MKNLFVFVLLLSLSLKAQNIKITKGVEFPIQKSKWTNIALESDSTGFYYFRSIGGYYSTKYVLHKLDAHKSSTIFEKEIDLSGDSYLGGEGYFKAAHNINGKIRIFTQAIKGKTNHFMMQEFSSVTGEAFGPPVIVDAMEDTKAYIISESILKFHVNFSPDHSKMLVVAELKKDEKIQKVFAKLYSTEGYKKIWEKEPIGTYSNSTVSSFDYHVDNEGTFYYLFVYLRSGEQKLYTVGQNIYSYYDYAHGIGLCRPTSTANKIMLIPSKGITTFEPKLEIVQNKIVCSGHFVEGEFKNKGADELANIGFFFLTVDPLIAEIKTSHFKLLDDTYRAKLAVKDKGKRHEFAGNKEYQNLQTLWINGSFYNIQLRTIDKGYVGAYGKEILVFKYDAASKLQWVKLIPRSTYEDLNGLNFLATNKLNLFYYDLPENLSAFPSAGD